MLTYIKNVKTLTISEEDKEFVDKPNYDALKYFYHCSQEMDINEEPITIDTFLELFVQISQRIKNSDTEDMYESQFEFYLNNITNDDQEEDNDNYYHVYKKIDSYAFWDMVDDIHIFKEINS